MTVLYRLLASTRADHTRIDFDTERIRALEELHRTQEDEHQPDCSNLVYGRFQPRHKQRGDRKPPPQQPRDS
ncbi:D-serine/D-alanine/glycine transporter [Cutibacterium acnes JCM 18920]|nr:D-serine/D-alanine/glycine transporter [Cutibacterium acnes JCM 18920]